MEYYIFLIVTAVMFVVLNGVVFPRMILRKKYDITDNTDIGIKRVLLKKGRAIVARPVVSARDYIEQYVISDRDDKKSLVCKIATDIYFLRYTVVVYDISDKIIDVIKAEELINEPGYTAELILPQNTSYVSVSVDTVNYSEKKSAVKAYIPVSRTVIYGTVCFIMTLLCAMFIRYCVGGIAGGPVEEFMASMLDITITASVAVLLTVIQMFVVLAAYSRADTIKVKRSEPDE